MCNKRWYSLIGLCWAFLLMSGCHVYRVPVQQGNIVNSQLIRQLTPGMTKEEVVKLLGNPIIEDIFGSNVWTYVYDERKMGAKQSLNNYQVILEFSGDHLKTIKH